MIIKNEFRVPAKQWKKWDRELQKCVFNKVYETMKNNQTLFVHPKTELVSPEQWDTTCWNAAWTAADAAK